MNKKRELSARFAGLAPIDELLNNKNVTQVNINSPTEIYFEKDGRHVFFDRGFSTSKSFGDMIQNVLDSLNKKIGKKTFYISGILENTWQVHVVLPPLAPNGPVLSLTRIFDANLKMEELLDLNALSDEMAEFLQLCVAGGKNIAISGNLGAFQGHLLRLLADRIDKSCRTVLLGNNLPFYRENMASVSLENLFGCLGEDELRSNHLEKIVRALRPDWILHDDVWNEEVTSAHLRLLSLGYSGILSIYSSSARDCASRLETLLHNSSQNLSPEAARNLIASGISVFVHIARLSDGSRRIISVSEVISPTNGALELQDIFLFQCHGLTSSRTIIGQFVATGYIPSFIKELKIQGY